MVSLTGEARAVGERWGRLNAQSVRTQALGALAKWRGSGLSDKEMMKRTGKFRRFIARFAPHWMDEMAGCAKAAGVPLDSYAIYEGGSSRSIILMHECTSFAAVGSATADGAPLFHRTRDTAAGKMLAAKEGRISLPDMIAAGRHADICGGQSIAGFAVRVDPKSPAALSSLWIAQPPRQTPSHNAHDRELPVTPTVPVVSGMQVRREPFSQPAGALPRRQGGAG